MQQGIPISTTDHIEGRRIVKTLGLVKGNTIRARHLGQDILAGFRNLVGGEVIEYTRLLYESREQAEQRMVAQAQKLGANAVAGVSYVTSMVMSRAAELLV